MIKWSDSTFGLSLAKKFTVISTASNKVFDKSLDVLILENHEERSPTRETQNDYIQEPLQHSTGANVLYKQNAIELRRGKQIFGKRLTSGWKTALTYHVNQSALFTGFNLQRNINTCDKLLLVVRRQIIFANQRLLFLSPSVPFVSLAKTVERMGIKNIVVWPACLEMVNQHLTIVTVKGLKPVVYKGSQQQFCRIESTGIGGSINLLDAREQGQEVARFFINVRRVIVQDQVQSFGPLQMFGDVAQRIQKAEVIISFHSVGQHAPNVNVKGHDQFGCAVAFILNLPPQNLSQTQGWSRCGSAQDLQIGLFIHADAPLAFAGRRLHPLVALKHPSCLANEEFVNVGPFSVAAAVRWQAGLYQHPSHGGVVDVFDNGLSDDFLLEAAHIPAVDLPAISTGARANHTLDLHPLQRGKNSRAVRYARHPRWQPPHNPGNVAIGTIARSDCSPASTGCLGVTRPDSTQIASGLGGLRAESFALLQSCAPKKAEMPGQNKTLGVTVSSSVKKTFSWVDKLQTSAINLYKNFCCTPLEQTSANVHVLEHKESSVWNIRRNLENSLSSALATGLLMQQQGCVVQGDFLQRFCYIDPAVFRLRNTRKKRIIRNSMHRFRMLKEIAKNVANVENFCRSLKGLIALENVVSVFQTAIWWKDCALDLLHKGLGDAFELIMAEDICSWFTHFRGNFL